MEREANDETSAAESAARAEAEASGVLFSRAVGLEYPHFLNDSLMTLLKTRGHVEIHSFCQVK